MGNLHEAIKLAYKKGCRVTDDGKLIGMTGKILSVKCRGKQRYPTFSVSGLITVSNKYGVFGVPVHKFAAFCFYGEDSFSSECVRHLDGDVTNISRSNIVLGTHKDNSLDKDPAARSNAARKARAAQGVRPVNSRFNDDQVRYIRTEAKTRSQKSIADELGVTRACIFRIVKGLNYGDVT